MQTNLSVFVFFIYLFFNSVAMSVVYCFCSWCCFLCYFLVCNLLLWPLCILNICNTLKYIHCLWGICSFRFAR